MKKLFEQILQYMGNGENVVLATVIESSGSTPGRTGAHMLVRMDGSIAGTIGGGMVEYKTQQLAAEVLRDKSSYIKNFRLAPNQAADLGMICGGEAMVFFQYISAGDKLTRATLEKAIRLCDGEKSSWLITDITDETCWNMFVVSEGEDIDIPDNLRGHLPKNHEVLVKQGGRRCFVEPLAHTGRVIIFGGGHIAQELVPVLSHIDFRCMVVDDRKQFANKTLFPSADSVLLGGFSNIRGSVSIGADDYVVIVTRGHQHDFTVQAQVLRTNACYIGVIGSREKTASVSKRLMDEEGLKQADLDRIHTPIGINIKAKTPAEIAISIAAELILFRAVYQSVKQKTFLGCL